jgi:hypothetical protein
MREKVAEAVGRMRVGKVKRPARNTLTALSRDTREKGAHA